MKPAHTTPAESAALRQRGATLFVAADRPALMAHAAARIATLAEQAIAARGRFTWALSGGDTPRSLFALLAARYATRVDWGRVCFFWGDERCVPPDDPESNFGMARATLLDAVKPPPEHVHRMRGEEVPARAAAEYAQVLRDVLLHGRGVRDDAPPSFDLVLLGLGQNGHTASLFPGSSALEETERWVVASHVEAATPWRITLTRPIIDAGAHVLFLVSGREKAGALKAILEPGPEDPILPAARIRPAPGALEWMVDADAASHLESVASRPSAAPLRDGP